MIGRAPIGLAVFSSLYLWLWCVICSAGGNTGAAACLVEPKGDADFAIYKN